MQKFLKENTEILFKSTVKILDSVELNMEDTISTKSIKRIKIEDITFQLEIRDNNKSGRNNQPRNQTRWEVIKSKVKRIKLQF